MTSGQRARWIALCLSMLLAVPGLAQQPGQFRATASGIVVDVSVRQGSRVVNGLSKNDFLLFDNGVAQQILSVEQGVMPLHVTVVMDVSGSMTDRARDTALRLSESVAALCRPTDRFDVVGLAGRTSRLGKGQTALPQLSPLARRTALLDGLATVLLARPQPGFRHLILALTDAVETSSLIPSSVVAALSERSDAVLHVIAIKDPRVPEPHLGREWNYDMLAAMAASGGGRFYQMPLDGQIEPYVASVFDDIRQRYLLHFVPSGVSRQGWHDIQVKVTRPGRFDIAARKGYHIDPGDGNGRPTPAARQMREDKHVSEDSTRR